MQISAIFHLLATYIHTEQATNEFVFFSVCHLQVVKVANVSLLALYKEKKERPRS